jgi:hypothetical protein
LREDILVKDDVTKERRSAWGLNRLIKNCLAMAMFGFVVTNKIYLPENVSIQSRAKFDRTADDELSCACSAKLIF